LILAVALLGACGADHTLGGVPPTGGAGTSGAAGTSGGAAGSGAAGSSASGAAGTGVEIGPLGPTESWTGYVENKAFPSGSDQIKLTFATDSAGHVVGTVVFGQGTHPPPATDPDVGYPPSFHPGGIGVTTGFSMEGYVYTASGTLEANRLRIKVGFGQVWKDWCALQTSYVPPGRCLPATQSTLDPMQMKCSYTSLITKKETPANCDKVAMCLLNSVCECDATSCRANLGGANVIDLQLTGNTAAGSIVAPVDGYVRFTKDP
jgi:hypothetical protein